MPALLDFLSRNTIDRDKALPLVHTCEAILLKKILRSKQLRTAPCNVFRGEQLLYFFVGRPAYKKEVALEPHYWELPVCFICEFGVAGSRRIFPFDTGAFANGSYPNFISIADMEDYNLSGDPDSVQKIIGTFFGDRLSYYRLKARSESDFTSRYSVDILDEEVRALHALIATRMPKTTDDRRASIEVSFSTAYDLSRGKVLAVVLPEIYLESDEIIQHIEVELNAEPIAYPITTQNVSYYFATIYALVEQFYQRNGFFRV